MNKDAVVPQWFSVNVDHVWFDPTPWGDRDAVLESAERFKVEGLGIRLAGIWRVKELK